MEEYDAGGRVRRRFWRQRLKHLFGSKAAIASPSLCDARTLLPRLGDRDLLCLMCPEDIAHGEYDYSKSDFFCRSRNVAYSRTAFAPGGETQLHARQSVCAMHDGRLFSLAAVSIFLERIVNFSVLPRIFSIPVAQTLSGKGAIPCIHPLSVGLFGRWSRDCQ